MTFRNVQDILLKLWQAICFLSGNTIFESYTATNGDRLSLICSTVVFGRHLLVTFESNTCRAECRRGYLCRTEYESKVIF